MLSKSLRFSDVFFHFVEDIGRDENK